MSRDRAHLPVFAVLFALAWLALSGQLLAEYWPATAVTLPDADDAMRLLEVRKFLSGGLAGWFDLHEPRLGLSGYDTHWSRFVDAGIGGLFLFFRLFADGALAERLTVAVWPLLWLIPMIGSVVAIAWRFAGREAAMVVLLLAIFSGPGIQQFRPGRIDHHNVQIALAILVVAATVWSDRLRWTAPVAGALTALAQAIGFEGLPFLALCGAAFALHYVFSSAGREPLRSYGLALAGGISAAFLLSVPPSRWIQPVCDTIAINSAAALMIVGLGLAGVASLPGLSSRLARLGACAVVAVLAVGVFVWLDPRCLGGHYALVDPAVRPIWLDNVSETKPLLELIRQAAATGLATVAFPLAAMIAVLLLVLYRNAGRSFGTLTAIAALAMSILYMLSALRGYSSAVWLGMPFVAAALCELFRVARISNLALRFIVTLLVTPTALTLGTMSLASAAGQPELTNLNPPERAGCISRSAYAPLAKLAPGRMAINDLEWGPYMLAWTPHSVLAAPYHRLSPSIVLSYRIFAEPPAEAGRLAAEAGVSYLAICGRRGMAGLSEGQRMASLLARLQEGQVPAWLEPVQTAAGTPFAVYRVRP